VIYPINLDTAVQALAAYFGSPLSTSRLGGEKRFTAVLRDQFGMTEPDACSVVSALVRRQALRWIAESGLPRPSCPGILEVSGQWRIEPDRMREI
jgi:hypothetical protein